MSLYTTILTDPPWEYDDKLRMSSTKRSSTDQYTTMSVQEICDLYTPQHITIHGKVFEKAVGHLAQHPIADIALLGLWITPPFLLEGIHNRVCNAWGFTPRQIVPWIKGRLVVDHAMLPTPAAKLVIQPGMGHLSRVCVEYLVLATRGKYTQLVKSHSENGLLLAEQEAFIIAPKSKHSRKPQDAYAMLERLFPGPYLELFARERRDNWTSWGNELKCEPEEPIFKPYEPAPDGPIFLTDQGVHQLQPDNTVKTISDAPKRQKRRAAPADVEIIEWP